MIRYMIDSRVKYDVDNDDLIQLAIIVIDSSEIFIGNRVIIHNVMHAMLIESCDYR